MNSQDSSCEWRKKIVKPNSPCVLSLEDKTNAAEHKVLRPNPKKDLAVRQTSVPKSKTARPKYHQLDCGSNETVLAVPLHSEILVFFSFPCAQLPQPVGEGCLAPSGRQQGTGVAEDPWSTSSHPAGFGCCNSLFPNVLGGSGGGLPFCTPYSWVFGQVWSGIVCCHLPGACSLSGWVAGAVGWRLMGWFCPLNLS